MFLALMLDQDIMRPPVHTDIPATRHEYKKQTEHELMCSTTKFVITFQTRSHTFVIGPYGMTI